MTFLKPWNDSEVPTCVIQYYMSSWDSIFCRVLKLEDFFSGSELKMWSFDKKERGFSPLRMIFTLE